MKAQLVYDENNLPYASNPENRVLAIGIADASFSMRENERIEKLNSGSQKLLETINSDVLARRRVDLAWIKCNNSSPELILPITTVQDIKDHPNAFSFEASGGTPMNESLLLAMELVEKHKEKLKQNGIAYYKPMIFVLSDGEFYVSQETIRKLHQSEERNGHTIFPVGVGKDVRAEDLAAISSKGRAFLLDDTNFADLFEFMSSSLSSVSQSSPGDKLSVAIPGSMKVVERKEVDL